MLKAAAASLVLLLAVLCFAQTPSAPAGSTGVLRLRARIKVGDSTRGLSRKRFFLIKGSLEQNKSLTQAIEQRSPVSRECFYRSLGASEALIKWLKDNDCESVYCRELQTEDTDGAGAVPEFTLALAAGEKEYGNRDLARKWLPVNLPEKIRIGFYKSRQLELETLIKQAETASGARVLSVMTDRNGTAYFTNLEPGSYTLSNIIGTEIGNSSTVWNCDVAVKPGDLATEKPFLISNRKDRNVKCVAVEKPLPACAPGN
ncbi:MAG TPA: prealbumin-like fold domain-containing protein [Pyrinomonadaceae bacterium]|nr:prealbumin-like fold domain-containing protein [Pyrinomonadaceae bacterium]